MEQVEGKTTVFSGTPPANYDFSRDFQIVSLGTAGGMIGLRLMRDFYPLMFDALQWCDIGTNFRDSIKATLSDDDFPTDARKEEATAKILRNLPLTEILEGTGRNPFKARLLARFFEAHLRDNLAKRARPVVISAPGGGWNSGTIDLFRDWATTGYGVAIWIAIVTDSGTPAERFGRIWAMYMGLRAFDIPIIIERDTIERLFVKKELHRVLGVAWTDGIATWQDAISRVVAKLLVALYRYRNPDSDFKQDFMDLMRMRPFWGQNTKTTSPTAPFFYLVPLLVAGRYHPVLMLAEAMREGLLCALSEPSENLKEKGPAKGALIIVSGPQELLRSLDETELRTAYSMLLRIPKAALILLLFRDDSMTQIEVCCLLASPPLKRFQELAFLAQELALTVLREWQDDIREFASDPKILAMIEAAAKKCHAHGHTDTGDLMSFLKIARTQLEEMPREFAAALEWFSRFQGREQDFSGIIHDKQRPQYFDEEEVLGRYLAVTKVPVTRPPRLERTA